VERKLIHLILLGAFLPLLAAPMAQAQAGAPGEKLTLEQAVALALEKNPALRAQGEEKNIARARAGQARAAWLPRVDFSQGFTRGNNPVYVFGTKLMQRQFSTADFALNNLNTPLPLNNHQSRIEGQWLLFDSFAREQRIAGARKLETAADFATEQARQDLILQVVRAYYGVVVARENLAAAREALRTAEATEQRVAAMEKAGLVVASDLLSAQVFRAQMKEREIRAANQLQLARATLAWELGFAPEALHEPAESLAAPASAEITFEEWEQRALSARPALREAELQQQAAGSNARAARSDFGPRVGAFAAFERDAERLASGPSGTNWTAGLRVELNLFAGGADRARLAEAQARERQAAQQLEWFRTGVRLEVRQAFLETQAAQARVEAARGTVEQAKESLRIIENRHSAGLATITDVLRAQSAALEARAMLAAALHDAQVARAALRRAAGALSPEELRK
jgi:TolC family type I secretion outer membrane protein